MNDFDLLQQYVRQRSETAFATLVGRYIGLIYSAALRQVGDSQLAEEVTQTTFIILARKAHRLRPGATLSGWLYQTARFAASDALKSEQRRKQREQEVARMETGSAENSAWEEVVPILDKGMARLSERDRNALLLRYFENRSLAEVGTTQGISSDSARMRIGRALGKLRTFLTRRGVVLSSGTLVGLLSSKTVQAAPAGLATSTTTLACVKGASAAESTLALVNGTLKLMTWVKIKIAAYAVVACLLPVGGIGLAVEKAVGKKVLNKPPNRLTLLLLRTLSREKMTADGVDAEVTIYDPSRPSDGTNHLLVKIMFPGEKR